MVAELLDWMDGHFGHDLTDIVVSTTFIERGVALAFSLPQFGSLAKYQKPVATLLSTGFARHYRHNSWSEIAKNQAYGHVITQFGPVAAREIPELRLAIIKTLDHVQDELNRGDY
jgi:hypothetical protein